MRVAFILSLFAVMLGTSAAEAKKVALVIGNSAYQNAVPLANPVNDAKAMSEKLEALGFAVVTGFDQDYRSMQATVNGFAREAIGADIALLFYAGHGMQVRGDNYLIPIDAAFKDETSLDFEAVPVDFVLRQMSRDVRLRMVFLDACRDNPLSKVLARSMEPSRSASIGEGLAEIKIDDAGEGTVIAFATSPGDVAYDGKSAHSPFTRALLDHIDAADLPLQNVMTRVTRDVYEATNQKQRPWINASLIGEIYLNKSDVEVAALGETPSMPESVAAVVPQLAISAVPAKGDPVAWDQEKTLFEFAQKSGAPEDFQAYLASYPTGHFADIARNFIERSRVGDSESADRKVAALPDADGLTPRTPFADAAPFTAAEAPLTAAASTNVQPNAIEIGTDVTEAVLTWDKVRRREVQARLELEGIELGTPDGNFGPKTRQAIASWQAGRNVPATGYFSASQYDLLVSRTVQQFAVWQVEDRDRRAAPVKAKSPGKTRSVEKARPRKTQAVRQQRGTLVGRAEPRRRDGNADVAGAAFVGGLIGGAIGGAIGR
ncbi:MAG: caspase family protein [Rhizobiaceae bacterium]|nr:caspase family protein [Rhizobiaceae bacterium]